MNQNDSELRRLYREGSRDEPGADLDSAILAAAHREVDARPGRRVFRAWGIPLSAAAVLMLSATLTLVVFQEPDSPATISSPQAPAEEKADSVHRDEQALAQKDEPKPAVTTKQDEPKPAASPSQEQALLKEADKERPDRERGTSADRYDEDRKHEPQNKEAEDSLSAVRSAPSPAAQSAKSSAEEPPEQWIARIEKLRAEGRIDEARASFAEFSRRYPEYALPPWALKAWAEIKKAPAGPGRQEESGRKKN